MKELENLEVAIQQKRLQLQQYELLLQRCRDSLIQVPVKWACIPKPICPARNRNLDVPSVSGIYFIWRDGRVVYVGQSTNLRNRVKPTMHACIFAGDWVSWLLFPPEQLNFAEAFYIGVCCPIRNWGGIVAASERSDFVTELELATQPNRVAVRVFKRHKNGPRKPRKKPVSMGPRRMGVFGRPRRADYPIQQAYELHLQGVSKSVLAREFNVSRATLMRAFKQMAVQNQMLNCTPVHNSDQKLDLKQESSR